MLMKQKLKLPKLPFAALVGVLIFCTPAFSAAQNGQYQESFWERADFFVELTPSFMINTESKTVSAPNPAFFSLGVGMVYPNDTFFSFEPSFHFFWNYYLVNNGNVYPAEIENRTATALSFLFNFPAVFSIKPTERSKMKLSPGAAFLLRIPVIAGGVNATDSGWYGTVQDDIDNMGRWFYENGRFLFLSFNAAWIFEHIEKISFGPCVAVYFPLIANLIEKNANGMIVQVGLRLIF